MNNTFRNTFYAPFMVMFLLMACSKDSQIKSIVVEGDKPTASFSNTTGSTEITFTNTSQNAETYFWQFGDASTSTEKSPVHKYAAAGRYTVTLSTRSASGYSAQTSSILVAATKAEANFVTATASGVYVAFNNTSVSLDSCVWDFGDNSSTSTAISPNHAFPAPGTYSVTLTIQGIGGDKSSITKNVTVGYECINGGGFEVDDAKYWKTWSNQANNPPTFGYTADKPMAGSGGCLAFPSFTAPSGGSINHLLYQPVYVLAGKKYQFSALVKLPAGGKQCYMQFYLTNDENTWSENNGNTPTQLFVSLNTWHGWGGTSGAGPTIAVDGSMIAITHSFGSYGPYASDGIYTATTSGWMYLGIQAGSSQGYSGGAYLIDDVSFKQIP